MESNLKLEIMKKNNNNSGMRYQLHKIAKLAKCYKFFKV